MTSTFAWLDHSEEHRRQILDVLDLFRERSTVDELGLGTIRDAFADMFFPGTSAPQTRLDISCSSRGFISAWSGNEFHRLR